MQDYERILVCLEISINMGNIRMLDCCNYDYDGEVLSSSTLSQQCSCYDQASY